MYFYVFELRVKCIAIISYAQQMEKEDAPRVMGPSRGSVLSCRRDLEVEVLSMTWVQLTTQSLLH